MTLFVIVYPYHSVRAILSMPFCPVPFCPYTILSIPFCPYHFVRYHFVLEPHIYIHVVEKRVFWRKSAERPDPAFPTIIHFTNSTGEPSASFRSLKTDLFSLSLLHWKRF